jgi:hypothetical protein
MRFALFHGAMPEKAARGDKIDYRQAIISLHQVSLGFDFTAPKICALCNTSE